MAHFWHFWRFYFGKERFTPEERPLIFTVGVLVSLFVLILFLSMSRYTRLVDTEEARIAFRAKYRIPDNVEFRHCEEGEWLVINRPPGSVVIPMIAFIEGGMELPMSPVTKDYLKIGRAHV